jgi:hypothetical protein
MELPLLENPAPITDADGTVWDLYWMTTMIQSTDLSTGSPSVYAEFFPCRVGEDGVKVIKTDVLAGEIKSINLSGLFSAAEENPAMAQIMAGTLMLMKAVGQQMGLFK